MAETFDSIFYQTCQIENVVAPTAALIFLALMFLTLKVAVMVLPIWLFVDIGKFWLANVRCRF